MFRKNNLSIRFGDALYNLTNTIVYNALYPLFSIIRSAMNAISECWNDAGYF